MRRPVVLFYLFGAALLTTGLTALVERAFDERCWEPIEASIAAQSLATAVTFLRDDQSLAPIAYEYVVDGRTYRTSTRSGDLNHGDYLFSNTISVYYNRYLPSISRDERPRKRSLAIPLGTVSAILFSIWLREFLADRKGQHQRAALN